jgi:hypothetical protein
MTATAAPGPAGEVADRYMQMFVTHWAPPLLAALGDDPDARLRAALVLSQTLEPLASADPQVIPDAIRDVINLQLTRPLS